MDLWVAHHSATRRLPVCVLEEYTQMPVVLSIGSSKGGV